MSKIAAATIEILRNNHSKGKVIPTTINQSNSLTLIETVTIFYWQEKNLEIDKCQLVFSRR